MARIMGFIFGALAYGTMEVLWRGYTHATMLLAGGLCFLGLCKISTLAIPLFMQVLMGAGMITAVEFLFGCVFNLALKLNVWDYSNEGVHILGQVCLRYVVIWLMLCVVAIPLINLGRMVYFRILI